MPILKIGIELAVVIFAITLFSLSAGGITLLILIQKIPGSNLSSIKDDFARKANSVFGNTHIQRTVIRCILWGMSVVISFVKLLGRFRQAWARTQQVWSALRRRQGDAKGGEKGAPCRVALCKENISSQIKKVKCFLRFFVK
jgi:hypothetical protein